MAHSELYFGDISTPSPFFSDANIVSAPGTMAVDLVANQLSIDTFDFSIITATPSDVTGIAYGTPVWYFFNGSLVGKFFFKQAIRTSKTIYKLTVTSAVGLLENMNDAGGIFKAANGDTFLSVLAKILGGSAGAASNDLYPITGGVFDCLVDKQCGDLPVEGLLRYENKRVNLHELLFAESVSLTKANDGTPLFSFLYNQQTPTTIPPGKIYVNGAVNYEDAATAVEVTEHTFLDLGAADELVTLFDGSAEGTVNNALIVFNDPMHDLTATNLTISESGANYAIVSGAGVLTGRKYTHSRKTVRRDVLNPQGRQKVVTVSNVTMVNPLNSANVADRLLAFYSSAKTVDVDIVKDAQTPQCGRQYSFTGPFGDALTGFITKMDLNPSNIMRARCHIVTDYTPTGQGNNFKEAKLYTSGDITVPADVTHMRLVLIGGGNGGTDGSSGSRGGAPTLQIWDPDKGGYIGYAMHTAIGGDGGTGGDGGDPGRVLTVDLENLTPGDVITVTYGTGGTAGQTGTDTSITVNGTTYSTALPDGSVVPGGYTNLLTGEKLATPGNAGISGAKGGNGNDSTVNPGFSGGNVIFEGTTYSGGLGSQTTAYQSLQLGTRTIYGGGGGGAAFGTNGNNGHPQNGTDYLGVGGDGADAVQPAQAKPGCGGDGGNGGGGGGSSGLAFNTYNGTYLTYNQTALGGSGSAGGQGGPGAILAYY